MAEDLDIDSPRKDQLRQAILHRKESSGSKPLSQDASWMLDQCNSSTEDPGEGRFSSLHQDSQGTRAPDTQTYSQWRVNYSFHKVSHPMKTKRNTIILQPLSFTSPDYPVAVIEPQVMTHVHSFCKAFFHGVEIVLAQPLDLLTAKRLTRRVHRETNREQILVGSILRLLRGRKYSVKAFCVIGVTIVDLYPSAEWNFTLGQAYFADGIAVCSFGRYFNSQTSSSCSALAHQMTNLWILVKVLTHELCHLYGLTHCFYFSCAMNESNTIEEAVTQPLFLCPICLRKLHKVIKFSVRDRYHHMAEQCSKLSQILLSYETQSTGGMTVLDGIQDDSKILTSVEINHTPNDDRDTETQPTGGMTVLDGIPDDREVLTSVETNHTPNDNRDTETQPTGGMTVLDGIPDDSEIVTSVEINHTPNDDRDTETQPTGGMTVLDGIPDDREILTSVETNHTPNDDRDTETQPTGGMTVLDGIPDDSEIVTSVEINHTPTDDRDTALSDPSSKQDLSSTQRQPSKSAVDAQQEMDVMSPRTKQDNSNLPTLRQSSNATVDTENSTAAQQDMCVILSPITEQDLSEGTPTQIQSSAENSSTAQQDEGIITSPTSTGEHQSNSAPTQSIGSSSGNSAQQNNDSQGDELTSVLASARFASAVEWLQSSIASLDTHHNTTKLT